MRIFYCLFPIFYSPRSGLKMGAKEPSQFCREVVCGKKLRYEMGRDHENTEGE